MIWPNKYILDEEKENCSMIGKLWLGLLRHEIKKISFSSRVCIRGSMENETSLSLWSKEELLLRMNLVALHWIFSRVLMSLTKKVTTQENSTLIKGELVWCI